MERLAAADGVRNMMSAPAPGQANAVSDTISHVTRLIFDDDTSDEGTAYSARGGYRSDSSDDASSKSAARSRKSTTRGRSSSRSNEEHTAANNPCKYCKKHKRRNRHPQVPTKNCFWNKKWQGYRPRYCCRVLDIAYKPRDQFYHAMGGTKPDFGETTSDEESE